MFIKILEIYLEQIHHLVVINIERFINCSNISDINMFDKKDNLVDKTTGLLKEEAESHSYLKDFCYGETPEETLSMHDVDIFSFLSDLTFMKQKIKRYSGYLVNKGLEVAEERGYRPTLKQDSQGNIDISPLIELSQHQTPIVYNVFRSFQEKYASSVEELKSMLNR